MADISSVIWYDLLLNPSKVASVGALVEEDIRTNGLTITYTDPETKQVTTATFYGTYMGTWWQDFCGVPRVIVPDEDIQSVALEIVARRKVALGVQKLDNEPVAIGTTTLIIIGFIAAAMGVYWTVRMFELYNENQRIAAQHYRDKQVYYDDRLRDDDGNLIPIHGYYAYLAYLQSQYPGDYSWLDGKGYTEEGSNWWEGILPKGMDLGTILLIGGVLIVGAIILVNVLPMLLRRPQPPPPA